MDVVVVVVVVVEGDLKMRDEKAVSGEMCDACVRACVRWMLQVNEMRDLFDVLFVRGLGTVCFLTLVLVLHRISPAAAS